MVAVGMISCAQKEEVKSAVLLGEMRCDCDDVLVIDFDPVKGEDQIEVEVVDSKFEFKYEDISELAVFVVALNHDETFGACLYHGDTLRMVFTQREDGTHEAAYDGPHTDEYPIWDDWYNVYGYFGQYNIRADKDPDITEAQSLQLLNDQDSAFRAKYDGEISDYCLHRANTARDYIEVLLIESESYRTGTNELDNPRFVELVKDINLEDPVVIGSGLVPRWVHYQMRGLGEDRISQKIAFLRQFKGKIKSADARKIMVRYCASSILISPEDFSDETVAEMIDAMEEFEEWPDYYDKCRTTYETYKKVQPGNEMPDVEMVTPEGNKVLLSSLFGKIIYIDMWATWCGPCVKETPAMEALAGRMSSRDDIVCISISTDETAKPWLEKLEKDQPDWPQYRLEPEAEEEFAKSLNINAIPRFIIVDKDGKIYDADAIRPSNPDIDATLIAAAEGSK